MNIIRNIEGATLLAVGAFCAAAAASIILHSAQLVPASHAGATEAVVQLPAVVIVGKRLSNVEKSNRADQHAAG